MYDAIAQLFAHDGPFVSVYLDARSAQEQAADALDRHWKSARRELESQGADEATLAAVDDAVAGDHQGGETLAIVAARGRVLLRRHLPEPPDADRGRFGALPWVGPLMETAQTLIPHLVVMVDHAGADVYGFTVDGDDVSSEVDGDTEHIHRGKPGGWSQRRFQQRAENTWEDNARLAAEKTTKLAHEIGARLILVGGDPRSVPMLCDALPEDIAPLARPLDAGNRAAGGSLDAVVDEVQRQVDNVAAEDTVGLVRELKDHMGRGGRAVVGPGEVVRCLQRAVVETLLVHDAPDDDRTVWIGPEPVQLAHERSDLVGMGVEEPREARLVDACIRAATGTGGRVHIAPATIVTDGLAAILRHTGTTPETPGS